MTTFLSGITYLLRQFPYVYFPLSTTAPGHSPRETLHHLWGDDAHKCNIRTEEKTEEKNFRKNGARCWNWYRGRRIGERHNARETMPRKQSASATQTKKKYKRVLSPTGDNYACLLIICLLCVPLCKPAFCSAFSSSVPTHRVLFFTDAFLSCRCELIGSVVDEFNSYED